MEELQAEKCRKSDTETRPRLDSTMHKNMGTEVQKNGNRCSGLMSRNFETQNVISLCGCRWWEYRGQSGGIDISAVFRVLQLISLDFSETTAHPDLIQSSSSPLPPSNCFCLFINRTCYLQRSRCRAAKYSQQQCGGQHPYS